MSSDTIIAVDTLDDDPMNGGMAAEAAAAAGTAAIVCVSSIGFVMLVLPSDPMSGLTLSFVINSNVVDTLIDTSSMPLLFELLLLLLMAFVTSLIVSAPGKQKRKNMRINRSTSNQITHVKKTTQKENRKEFNFGRSNLISILYV